MSWDSAANVAQVLSVVGAFLAFVITLSVKINKKLDAIQAQQKPNGGSSMRDAVDRMDKKLDNLDHRIDSVEKNLANLRGSYDEHTRINKG
jgi:uncharacterized membrane protein